MSDPRLPVGEGSVPDKALQELLAAFAEGEPIAADEIDFDDPSIDRMLGLGPDGAALAAPAGGPATEPNPVTEPDPVTEADPVTVTHPVAGAGDAPASADDPDALPPITSRVPEVVPDPVVGPEPGSTEDGLAPDAAVAPPTQVRQPIKIGGDGDDLPDALYLDEEAGDRLRGATRATEASIREERTTILIADDDMEGASGGIPLGSGSASMDPRLRARRIAVKRAVGRRRLKWFVLAGVIIAVLTAGLAVLGSSLFEVNNLDDISISGARRISQPDLDAAVNRILHHPVLLIDTHAIEAQLERTPWVREARVTTDFPHNASIELLERVPIATYAGPDGRFRIIDVEGRVVDVIDNQPVEFMLITGAGVNASPGTSAGDAFTHAAELVQALSSAVRSRTESVGVTDIGGLTLQFHNGAVVSLGAPTDLLDKLTRLEAFLKRDNDACTTAINVATNELGTCA